MIKGTKKYIPVLLYISIYNSTLSAASTAGYFDQAQLLMQEHLVQQRELAVSYADLQYLLNLLYLSYQRSYWSIQAHTASLQLLQEAWKHSRNVTRTLRDPWNTVPYPQALYNSTLYQRTLQTYTAHSSFGDIYSHAVFYAPTTAKPTQALISQIRDRSRDIRLDVLLREKTALLEKFKQVSCDTQQAAHTLADAIEQVATELSTIDTQSTSNSLSLTHAYITVDNTSHSISEKNWAALLSFEHAVAWCWQLVEAKRATFYKEYYNALYKFCVQNNLPDNYRTVLFDTIGLLPEDKRTEFLVHLP